MFPLDTPSISRPAGGTGELRVTWIGHSTTLIQLGGTNILTDPIWSRRASPVQWAGPARLVPPALRMEELPPVHVVLVSHNHYDHFDDRSIRRLARRFPEARWFAPPGLALALGRRGVREVTELGWWQEVEVGGGTGLRVGATPAQHFSARSPWDRNRSFWCGYAIRGDDLGVYFAGDTGYHPEFRRIAERFGPFDLCLIPIGAYEPRWFMRVVHMNPEEAVRAFQDLRRAHPATGRRGAFVPIHWGTFRLTDEPMEEPPERTRLAWAANGMEAGDLVVLRHGGTWERTED
ncbi:MAG: MBL fold metallo-hydrolase [Gemmatimonadales bacterium]